jgi:hypothetical protein
LYCYQLLWWAGVSSVRLLGSAAFLKKGLRDEASRCHHEWLSTDREDKFYFLEIDD